MSWVANGGTHEADLDRVVGVEDVALCLDPTDLVKEIDDDERRVEMRDCIECVSQ